MESSSSLRENQEAVSQDMRKRAAKELIERYYYQLTEGCGESDCNNRFCASSSDFCFPNIDKNVAAAKALELFRDKNPLCDTSKPSKVARNVCLDAADGDADTQKLVTPSSSSTNITTQSENQKTKRPLKTDCLTEKYLSEIIAHCREENNWKTLIHVIGSVFCNAESLMNSFLKEPEVLTKEDIRSMEIDQDKDHDEQEDVSLVDAGSSEEDSEEGSDMACFASDEVDSVNTHAAEYMVKTTPAQTDELSLDIESVRRAFTELYSIPECPFQSALLNAVTYLSRSIETDLQTFNTYMRNPSYINIFLILMEIPRLDYIEFLESSMPYFCKAFRLLPISCQAQLARIWSTFSEEHLSSMVSSTQQLITVRVISNTWSRNSFVNDEESIVGAAKLLKVLYYASILGGRMDSPELVAAERLLEKESEASLHELLRGSIGYEHKERVPLKEDPLGRVLDVQPINCRAPLVSLLDFVNEPLSEALEMDKDYTYYRSETAGKFSFMHHPFMLTTHAKNMGMYYDSRIRMINERRAAMFQNIVSYQANLSAQYLRLRIRRDHVIDDALVNLEMVAMDNPQDLKKQLFVEFEGEQGIDEGGVSKEFFQLVIEELFNPDIGMFTFDEETQTFWFNPMSFENDAQFTLIGIVLGLAIYNNVILDIRFPMVVYRKLMGKLGTFEDLQFSHPSLANGLRNLLDYEGDVAEEFMQPFCVGTKDVFGNSQLHVLKENGDQIIVTEETRKEFVELYADFLLNKSVEKQFSAFRRGFQMVTDESPLRMLFHPNEIELLVCGSKELDFRDLERAAEYDGGYERDSQVIQFFWEVTHEFSIEQKRQLLQFATGSDRVPIGGLSKLKLIISRNGSDSDRLPTSHTCFNILLLPEYKAKEKLRERLLKAITYSKGFGML